NKKRAIEKQEAALAKEANQKRQRKQMLSIGLMIISVLVGFVVVIRGFFIKKVGDRKSTRLNSSHVSISYAVFCLKKKKKYRTERCCRPNQTIQRSDTRHREQRTT